MEAYKVAAPVFFADEGKTYMPGAVIRMDAAAAAPLVARGLLEGRGADSADLAGMTRAQLAGKARAAGLKVGPRDTKAQIAAALEGRC